MTNEPLDLNKLLQGIDIDLPEDGRQPPQEYQKEEEESPDATVFLQKIITEIWIYTDVEGKTYGTSSNQDIHILGEMPHSEALKLIQTKKTRRRRKQ